jgi:hypothetical protein
MCAKTAPASDLSVGRIVLWGFIAVLAGAALVEFMSRQGYESAWAAVDAKMDEGTRDRRIKESEIQQVLSGKTPEMVTSFEGRGKAPEAVKLAIYNWFTLNPVNSRSIYVYYDDENTVVQASQSEYMRGAETKPIISPDGDQPSPMAKAMGGEKTDAQRAAMAESYQKYAPPHMKEQLEKEKQEAAAKKAAEETAQPAGETPEGQPSVQETQPQP